MQIPIARISNVMGRNGVEIGRSPRWIDDANTDQIARMSAAVAAIRQK